MKKIVALLFFMCGSAYASNWQSLIDADNIKLMVDANSIAQSGKYKKAWFLESNPSNQDGNAYTNFKPYRSVRTLAYFSCEERTSAYIQTLYYSGDMGQGNFIGSFASRIGLVGFGEVAPDTVGETMLEYVCHRNVLVKQKK